MPQSPPNFLKIARTRAPECSKSLANIPFAAYQTAMNGLIYVALGGALGASGRYLLGHLAFRVFGPGYPWGTLFANLIGGFFMGMVVGWLAHRGSTLIGGGANLRLFLAVGGLGGFTTFSAFSLETLQMLERKTYGLAAGYVSASVVFSVLAVWIGLMLARKVFMP